jgi:hypothetical protein
MMRQGVDIVAQFLLTSYSGSGGEMGLLARDEARPAYYVYPMYRHFGQELVESSANKSGISIYAAKRNDGALTLMVINHSDQEQRLPVQLYGFTPTGVAEVYRLDQTHNAERIESQQIADGSSIAVPPYSMTLYVLP